MNKAFKIWVLVILIWSFYRFFLNFPEWIDEIIIKPIVFILLPIAVSGIKYIPGFENKKNIFEDISIGIVIGFTFAVSAITSHWFKYGAFIFSPIYNVFGAGILVYLSLSLATAFSEEILGRGIIFNQLKEKHSIFISALLSSTASLTIHLPILITQLNLIGTSLIVFLASVYLLSFVNCYLYQNRKNLILPILVHTFWNMAIILYI